MLASRIAEKYRDKDCAVLALNDGGVLVGVQIAKQLQCVIMLLLSNEIKLPLEPDALAGITSNGDFAYNTRYSTGEIDEFTNEYRGLIEQEKLSSMHDMNMLVSRGSVVNRKLLKGKNVILVSDGFKSSFPLDLAVAYLKTIKIEKLIIAAPLASVQAVDRMHVTADEIYCLSVVEDFMDTDHYYDRNDTPDHDEIIDRLKEFILKWQ